MRDVLGFCAGHEFSVRVGAGAAFAKADVAFVVEGSAVHHAGDIACAAFDGFAAFIDVGS